MHFLDYAASAVPNAVSAAELEKRRYQQDRVGVDVPSPANPARPVAIVTGTARETALMLELVLCEVVATLHRVRGAAPAREAELAAPCSHDEPIADTVSRAHSVALELRERVEELGRFV